MVFNWFRRQFNEPSATPEEQKQAETTPVKESQPEAAETPSQETSQDVAVDYLQWAKAAYKNIQQQQTQTEETAPAPEATETETVTEVVAETPPETAAPELPETETVVAVETLESPELVAVETEATRDEPADTPEQTTVPEAEPIADEPQVENPAIPSPEVEPIADEPQVENPAIPSPEAEPIADEPQVENPAIPSPEVEPIADEPQVENPAIPSPEVEPIADEPDPETPGSMANAAPEPAVPATLSFLERAAAERQARQERLQATAIEVPAPEVEQPAAATTETTDVEGIPGLVFDEGFLWSAEVLAAQGRRPEDVSVEEITWLKKLRQGLDKTRRNILNQLKAIVGQGPLNQAAVMEIEALLLQADVGVEATDYIISNLQNKLREEALPPEAAIAYLKQILRDMLDAPLQKSQNPGFAPDKDSFNIWLMTGVNGAGKTTTIGKIAHLAQKSGYKCLIGAADTFRAAAVEQVKIWGARSGVEVVANPGKNTDPAAVVFDAIAAAQARGTELLLVDTAGRLQNKKNLMDELSKIRRIIDKKAPNAKVESLLVLDATLGQNGLRQAEVFSQAAQLSGVVLTKLDGTARGGVALAVVQQLGLPIRFIGAGEGIEDLRPFSSYEFVEALLSG